MLTYLRGRARIQQPSSLEPELLTTHAALLPQKRPHLVSFMELGWLQEEAISGSWSLQRSGGENLFNS